MKVLLNLDNNESHISLQALQISREERIIMLTTPPHTSHCLRPLDKVIYGSLKSHYNSAVDCWMRNYPSQTLTIYDISALANSAYLLSMTPSNILLGFRSTGIYPLAVYIFPGKNLLLAK